jgi:hypothetical protein
MDGYSISKDVVENKQKKKKKERVGMELSKGYQEKKNFGGNNNDDDKTAFSPLFSFDVGNHNFTTTSRLEK